MVSGKGWDVGELLLLSGVPEPVPCSGWPRALADGLSLHCGIGGDQPGALRTTVCSDVTGEGAVGMNSSLQPELDALSLQRAFRFPSPGPF